MLDEPAITIYTRDQAITLDAPDTRPIWSLDLPIAQWLDSTPIEHLERSKVEPYADVKALDFDDIAAMFERFDMSKPEDMRDCALLAIALQTGHRVSALAGLRWKHASISRGRIVTLYF